MMKNRDILNQCIQRLSELPPIKSVNMTGRKAGMVREIDGIVELITHKGRIQLQVEVKGELKRPLPALLGMQKKDRDTPVIVFSRYINPSIAKDLKKYGVHFIDMIGNAYIHLDNVLYVDREGRKPVVPDQLKMPSIFNPKGMQLLFVLLTRENSLNDTVRILAKTADVSKDRVSTGLQELQRMGAIYKADQGMYKFSDKRNLLEQWLTNYGKRFRSSIILGAYRMPPSIEENVLERLNILLPQNRYAVGGTLGSDVLVHYYRGMSTEIYIQPDDLVNVQKAFNLIPAKETNITLFRLFSPGIMFQEANTETPVAHPLLIYAELLHTGQDRAVETAKIIYDEYLKKLFDEA